LNDGGDLGPGNRQHICVFGVPRGRDLTVERRKEFLQVQNALGQIAFGLHDFEIGVGYTSTFDSPLAVSSHFPLTVPNIIVLVGRQKIFYALLKPIFRAARNISYYHGA
jgi:hypothetical protein